METQGSTKSVAVSEAALEASVKAYDEDNYYNKQLEIGMKFQDYVTRALYREGLIVVGYSSRKYQREYGENMLGAEIKRDDQFRQYNRLFLETAEKSHPNKPDYVKSGILRPDHWLYVIGDEQTFYIFLSRNLRRIYERYEQKIIPTAIGRVMPLADAEKYALKIIERKSAA